MWRIRNNTAYKVGRGWGRDKDGVHEWIVAVKGTFDIRPDGSTDPAEEQLEPLLLPEYTGEPGASSLRYDADIVSAKPATDIILNATAYAPGGRAATNFTVEARIGNVRKALRVVGDRMWTEGLVDEVTEPEPVTKVPIVYERAWGGSDLSDPDPRRQRRDPRNPVGRGVVAHSSRRKGQPLPNFEYPGGHVEKSGPAGFGALDSFWSPRLEYGGTYGENWRENRLPLLPADWDPRCLLSAPPDQQPESHLRGGEPVELINLTESGWLRFNLPRAYFSFTTHISGRTEEHRAQLATVIVEPDYPRVIMVWQSVLKCGADVDYLDETVVREKRQLR